MRPEGGIAVLKGNLAPEGASIKQSAVSEDMLRFEGIARVFECEEKPKGDSFRRHQRRRCSGHSLRRPERRTGHAGDAGPHVGHHGHGAETGGPYDRRQILRRNARPCVGHIPLKPRRAALGAGERWGHHLSGAQIFLDCLKREKVATIFGFPGVLNLYDELFHSDIRHYLVRHEQAAVHAADGYARATGKVGVCLVTSGPGATNTVTGLATAYMDSIPLVVFSGQVPTPLIGNDAFQEADILGITRSCTKHNYLVKSVKDLGRHHARGLPHRAHRKARACRRRHSQGRHGRSHGLQASQKVDIPGYNPTTEGHPGQIERALDLLVKAKRPLLYVGGGVVLSDAYRELKRFAERFRVPVTMTLMGLGGFPGEHPRPRNARHARNLQGQHGHLQRRSVIAIGARFDDRVTGRIDKFATHAKIVHIDVDPTSISKNVVVDIPIVGDAKKVLQQILQILKKEHQGQQHARKARLAQ